ncbi:MAG: hypothetical protein HYX79_08520 [Chloroflexi bacterium]|nr:hypothetical protein [Chloroflexota bacterium]
MKYKRAAQMLGMTLALLATSVTPALAGKPQQVIQISNGYPSGAHFNLNVHGKDPATFTADPTATGGNSVFVSLYGDSTLTIRSDNRSGLTELSALDPYAEAFDNDPALVQLPYQAEGYYVFARIHGKPNNGKNGEPSTIILTPNPVPSVYNYYEDPTNPDALLALGLVTTGGVYELTSAGLVRFDPNATTGKGKSKAVDITGLFLWTGWVCDASLDTSGADGVPDGIINEYDVPISYDDPLNGGNGNGIIDPAELENWLTDMAALGLATFYNNEWIFNIADIVEQKQTITNDGTKLLQIRFYPVATTEFIR